MTMQASIHGRLVRDVKDIATSTGTRMAATSLAVDLEPSGKDITESVTEFINVLAFGKQAELLLKHGKGDLISAAGNTKYQQYNDQRQLVVIADSVISAKTVRPSNGSQNRKPAQAKQQAIDNQNNLNTPYNDKIDF